MKTKRILATIIGVSLLSLGLSGCGDDTPNPVKQGVDEIHQADDAVGNLNDLTKEAEETAKAAGE